MQIGFKKPLAAALCAFGGVNVLGAGAASAKPAPLDDGRRACTPGQVNFEIFRGEEDFFSGSEFKKITLRVGTREVTFTDINESDIRAGVIRANVASASDVFVTLQENDPPLFGDSTVTLKFKADGFEHGYAEDWKQQGHISALVTMTQCPGPTGQP